MAVAADVFVRQKRLTEDIAFYASNAGLYPLSQEKLEEIQTVFNVAFRHQGIEAGALLASVIDKLQQAGLAKAVETKGLSCKQCNAFTSEQVSSCPRCGHKVEKGSGLTWVLHCPGSKKLSDLKSLVLFPRGQQVAPAAPPQREVPLATVCWDMPVDTAIPSSWLAGFLNCLTMAGYGDESLFVRIWPVSWAFATRDYWSEHLINWAWMLHLLDLPQPGIAVVQPHSLVDRRSHSVTPLLLAKNYGTDALRYVMLGIKPGSGDAKLTEDQIIQRINQDLANELGNLVSRVIAMVERYADGLVPKPDVLTRTTADLELREVALDTPTVVAKHLESLEPHLALTATRRLIGQTNRFIEATAPWQLVTGTANQDRLHTVLYSLCEALRFIGTVLTPILPDTGEKILAQLGLALGQNFNHWDAMKQWGLLAAGTRISPLPPLFPRIIPGKTTEAEPELILREDLKRISLVVARIVSAERVATADWLLQLVLYDGTQRRRVLTPIARYYSTAELAGLKVILLANMRPVALEGIISEGEVLLVKTDDGGLKLVEVDADIPEGSKVYAIPD